MIDNINATIQSIEEERARLQDNQADLLHLAKQRFVEKLKDQENWYECDSKLKELSFQRRNWSSHEEKYFAYRPDSKFFVILNSEFEDLKYSFLINGCVIFRFNISEEDISPSFDPETATESTLKRIQIFRSDPCLLGIESIRKLLKAKIQLSHVTKNLESLKSDITALSEALELKVDTISKEEYSEDSIKETPVEILGPKPKTFLGRLFRNS